MTRKLAGREAGDVVVMAGPVLDLDVVEDVLILLGGLSINEGIEAVSDSHTGIGEDVLA